MSVVAVVFVTSATLLLLSSSRSERNAAAVVVAARGDDKGGQVTRYEDNPAYGLLLELPVVGLRTSPSLRLLRLLQTLRSLQTLRRPNYSMKRLYLILSSGLVKPSTFMSAEERYLTVI